MAARKSDFRILRAPAGVLAVVAASDHCFGRHRHGQYGIGWLTSGGQISASGRGEVEAEAGQVITVNPEETHDGRPLGDRGRSWRMLYFEPSLLAPLVADIAEESGKSFEFSHPVLTLEPIASLLRHAFASLTGAPDEEHNTSILLDLFGRLAGPRPLAETAAVPASLRRAQQWIDEDPAAPITLAELARLTGLSRFATLRGFRQFTGLTPHAYLLAQRLALAHRQIRAGTRLADVATGCGFADQSHMTRLFVRAYGLTPGALAAA